jgi:toluene monooxygenase system ferredoxin subunit
MAYQPVMTLDQLWSGEMTACYVRDRRVLLVNVGGEIQAYEDVCPHMRTPLSNGSLEGAVLTCATHGWVFDAKSGKGINPAQACLTRFPAVVEGNDILVDMEDSSAAPATSALGEKRP